MEPEANSDARTTHAPRVALFVTGGIAAYKACEVLRGLQKAGCEVRVAMTEAASKFVGPVTFEALSGHRVVTTLFDDPETPIPHIELAEWAELALVCPATANVIAKMANGIADDAVSSTLLAFTGRLVVAPAMNVHMWQSLATQTNVDTLSSRGALIAGPATGRLACGEEGPGKLAEVSQIVATTLFCLHADGDLAGRHVVVTAGPTPEAIDPVRYLSNASSGKMGYAIAAAAAAHGAHVTLVSGPVSLPVPPGVGIVRVTTAKEMLEATEDAFSLADAAILAAAVSDYRPEQESDHKLASKGCDMIVANDVSRADSTFGSDTDCVTLVTPHDVQGLDVMPKEKVAEVIIRRVAAMLRAAGPNSDSAPDPSLDETVLMPRADRS